MFNSTPAALLYIIISCRSSPIRLFARLCVGLFQRLHSSVKGRTHFGLGSEVRVWGGAGCVQRDRPDLKSDAHCLRWIVHGSVYGSLSSSLQVFVKISGQCLNLPLRQPHPVPVHEPLTPSLP